MHDRTCATRRAESARRATVPCSSLHRRRTLARERDPDFGAHGHVLLREPLQRDQRATSGRGMRRDRDVRIRGERGAVRPEERYVNRAITRFICSYLGSQEHAASLDLTHFGDDEEQSHGSLAYLRRGSMSFLARAGRNTRYPRPPMPSPTHIDSWIVTRRLVRLVRLVRLA